MRYFYVSILSFFLAISIAYYLGGVKASYIVSLLAILEVSLSFDNAVVNAKILETMDIKWQKRFLTWGMLIAVFGMRFFFPILIVSIVAGITLYETLDLAIYNPIEYHHYLEKNEHLIYAFGGSFLLMVFLNFFFDGDREEKWIKILENNFVTNNLMKVNSIELIIAISVGIFISFITQDVNVSIAYFSGILLNTIINSLDEFFSTSGIKAGIIGFLYLEILDASFSFDGVIGAFALTSNIFFIMLGLGVGALFVRSLTLWMVEKKTLNEYIYLEHGAHYAILALSIIMFIELFMKVEEVITGSIGIAFIALAFLHSIYNKRKGLA